MNWSSYSRYVGDVFGAPLAMEGLAAFFLESTFLGLWLFGWDRLPKRVHLADDLARRVRGRALGRVHHGGELVDAAPGRLRDRPDDEPPGADQHRRVVHQPGVRVGIHARDLGVPRHRLGRDARRVRVASPSSRPGEPVLPDSEGRPRRAGPGDRAPDDCGQQARRHRDDLPADEDRRCRSAVGDLSALFVLGVPDRRRQERRDARRRSSQIPHLLSVLATATGTVPVQGLNHLNEQYQQQYGPGYYIPNVFIQYWSMRVMAYLGALISLFALWGAWLLHRGKLATSKWFLRVAMWAIVTPFLMNTAGWLLTENGRQPWIVQGLMLVKDGVSASVSSTEIVDQPHLLRRAVLTARRRRRHVDVPLRAQGARRGRRRRGRALPPEGSEPSSDDERVPALTY